MGSSKQLFERPIQKWPKSDSKMTLFWVPLSPEIGCKYGRKWPKRGQKRGSKSDPKRGHFGGPGGGSKKGQKRGHFHVFHVRQVAHIVPCRMTGRPSKMTKSDKRGSEFQKGVKIDPKMSHFWPFWPPFLTPFWTPYFQGLGGKYRGNGPKRGFQKGVKKWPKKGSRRGPISEGGRIWHPSEIDPIWKSIRKIRDLGQMGSKVVILGVPPNMALPTGKSRKISYFLWFFRKITKMSLFVTFWLSGKVSKMALFLVRQAEMSFGVPLVRGV